jgi:hypothetical protein
VKVNATNMAAECRKPEHQNPLKFTTPKEIKTRQQVKGSIMILETDFRTYRT